MYRTITCLLSSELKTHVFRHSLTNLKGNCVNIRGAATISSITKDVKERKENKTDMTRIDTFVENLVRNRITKPKPRTNYNKTRKDASKQNRQAAHTNICIDNKISDLLATEQYEDVVELLHYCMTTNLSLSASMFSNVARCLSSAGNVSGIDAVQKLYTAKFQSAFKPENVFEHYKAEALWKSGRIDDAVNCFTCLLLEKSYDVVLVKKRRSMFTFLLHELVSKNDEKNIRHAIRVGEAVSQQQKSYNLLATIWKACFLSDYVNTQSLAEDILRSNSNSFELRNAIQPRVESILKGMDGNPDKIHRLLTVVLQLKLTNYYGPVTSQLLYYQCLNNNVSNAESTVLYAHENEIILDAAVLRFYLSLLNQQKIKVPWMVLAMKHGPPSPLPKVQIPKSKEFQLIF